MRTPQAILFIVLLVATIGSLFSLFLPDADTQGPSSGLHAQLVPVVDAFRKRERDAAAGRFASHDEMIELQTRLESAERFRPTFSSEKSAAADSRARSAVEEYANFVESLVGSRTRASDDRDTALNARLTKRVDQAMAMGPGSGLTRLKALLVQIALFVLLPATFVVAFGPSLFRAVRNGSLRRNGTLMHGVVIATSPTGMMTNYVPQYRATIRRDDGGTTTATLLSYAGLSRGAEVMVKVDPRRPRIAIIDSLQADGARGYDKL